jgi:hypothetical protein
MRNFPTREALVAAYWRKLASSIEAAYSNRGRVSKRGAEHALRTRQRRASRSPSRRRYGAAGSEATAALVPRAGAQFHSNL